jgi:hypothetical protein
VHPFAEPGGTRRLLEQLGPDLWPELGEVSEKPLVKTLAASISRMLDIKGLRARDMARALGGPVGAQHLFRFTLTSPEGKLDRRLLDPRGVEPDALWSTLADDRNATNRPPNPSFRRSIGRYAHLRHPLRGRRTTP